MILRSHAKVSQDHFSSFGGFTTWTASVFVLFTLTPFCINLNSRYFIFHARTYTSLIYRWYRLVNNVKTWRRCMCSSSELDEIIISSRYTNPHLPSTGCKARSVNFWNVQRADDNPKLIVREVMKLMTWWWHELDDLMTWTWWHNKCRLRGILLSDWNLVINVG